jgi:hypothetical protein
LDLQIPGLLEVSHTFPEARRVLVPAKRERRAATEDLREDVQMGMKKLRSRGMRRSI